MSRIWFVTGTDTGVGKTVLTLLLTHWLASEGRNVRAVKPFCSGGRDDAKRLFQAQSGRVPLDQINPWHFRRPLTPWLAARSEGRRIRLSAVVRFLRQSVPAAGELVVEGAGGVLSPLGEGFAARELITALRAIPIVVCPNRLGAINQVRLVMAALPAGTARRARIVLFDPCRADPSTRSNALVLGNILETERIHRLPWLPQGPHPPWSRSVEARLTRLMR